jgi:hypothetical protein
MQKEKLLKWQNGLAQCKLRIEIDRKWISGQHLYQEGKSSA